MIRRAAAPLLVAVLAAPVAAQMQAADAPGAILRGLDTVSGTTVDLEVAVGANVVLGPLNINLRACRYPVGNPTSDAYAGLQITSDRAASPLFDGWMIASAPALSALDHPRYDVWVLRCTTS